MRIQLAIGIWSSAFIASLGLGVGCGSTTEQTEQAEFTGCDDATNTQQNGFVTCSSETVHRPRIEACTLTAPRSDFECEVGSLPDDLSCQRDSECTAEANGYCHVVGGFAQACRCSYGCTQDTDCGANQICQCNGVAGECVPAGCTQDSDCPGSVCASYDVDFCGSEVPGFACVTSRDECLSHADCPTGGCYYADGKRTCGTDFCAGGRPFLVQSEIRTAALRPGSGWSCDAALRLDPSSQALPESIRTEIAAHYLRNGLMEHASIAAFARFSLQLMGLGAPKDLVMQSIAAQADELVHAELCFSVAAQFTPGLEPAELELAGALDALSPEAVLITTILEGCIGETVAAALAEEAALLCSDPALKAVHRQIASDEARHSQLAWRSVKWLLNTYPDLKPAAAREFDRALAAPCHAENVLPAAAIASLETHGVLSSERSARLHAAVLRGVIAPAARALLGQSQHPRAAAAAA